MTAQSNIRKNTKNKPKVPKKITERYLYNSGLYYLQRYAASVHHFHSVMTRKIDRSLAYHKAPERDECLKILDKMTQEFVEAGYLNDQSYALGLARSLRQRGVSLKMAVMKMKAKGVEAQLAIQSIEKIDQEHSDHTDHESMHNREIEAALNLSKRRKIGPYRKYDLSALDRLEKDKALRREVGVLARAGFDYGVCKTITDMKGIDDLNPE